jgi:hypothetical protein
VARGGRAVQAGDAMIVVAGAILGIVVGAGLARARGGKPLDMAHYAAAFAIAFMILALFATIAIERSL